MAKKKDTPEIPVTPASDLFSQIRVTPFEKDSLRALVTVKIADAFYLTGLRIIEGKNGLFVTMPSKKTGSGEYQDVFFPASKNVREQLQAGVLEAYNAELTKGSETEDPASN